MHRVRTTVHEKHCETQMGYQGSAIAGPGLSRGAEEEEEGEEEAEEGGEEGKCAMRRNAVRYA